MNTAQQANCPTIHRDRLEVVLKTVERCNINCTYCYYFNKSYTGYARRRPYIAPKTIRVLGAFLSDAVSDLSLQEIQIDIHGGEPTMQRKQEFDWMCGYLREELASIDLKFNIQTNAMLVDEGWIRLFQKYRVDVGVSVDGPARYHDIFRIDHKGRGTYVKTRDGIVRLKQAEQDGRIGSVGALVVINPKFDAATVYNHITQDLGLTQIDFLLPDETHDSFGNQGSEAYGRYLCDLYDKWLVKPERVVIRYIRRTLLRLLSAGDFGVFSNYKHNARKYPIITIQNNGDLRIDDSLRTLPVWEEASEANINSVSLKRFLTYPVFNSLERAALHLPEICQKCCWEKVCGGGYLVHRHSRDNGFNNESIYCRAMQMFFAHVGTNLLHNDISAGSLAASIFSGIPIDLQAVRCERYPRR